MIAQVQFVEEEFGVVLDDNGFGGWHNVGWWVAQWNRWQCAQGATCHRCHQTICHPPPQYFYTFWYQLFLILLPGTKHFYTFWYYLLLAATFATEIS